jgi:uncharacterized damage-inducible protein DinB
VSRPEVWLRGPVPGVAAVLQPVVHSFLQVEEELPPTLEGLTTDALWRDIGGGWSIGQHVRHLCGSTDRLLTYARGLPLDPGQVAGLERERMVPEPAPDARALTGELRERLSAALQEVRAWSAREAELLEARAVGRSGLPSTVLGLLFHAAEHAQRHAAQVAVLRRLT